MNSFLADGGDSFPGFHAGTMTLGGVTDTDAFEANLAHEEPLRERDSVGRPRPRLAARLGRSSAGIAVIDDVGRLKESCLTKRADRASVRVGAQNGVAEAMLMQANERFTSRVA